MQLIKSLINYDAFIDWHWVKLVLQFYTDDFSIILEMNLHSIFLQYINNLFSFWSYIWISSYYLINQIQICILMNLNFKWNADIFLDYAEWYSEILSENNFVSVCCIKHVKQIKFWLIYLTCSAQQTLTKLFFNRILKYHSAQSMRMSAFYLKFKFIRMQIWIWLIK